MIAHTPPSSARDLFGFMQSRVSRLQDSVQLRLRQLALSATITTPILPLSPSPCSPSKTLQSTFVCRNVHSKFRGGLKTTSPRVCSDSSDLVLNGIEGLSLRIIMYLDGHSLGHVQLVNRSFWEFVQAHQSLLFTHIVDYSFDYVIRSSTSFRSFLFSLRHELDQELAHNRCVQRTHMMLEEYCTTIEPENHGFIAMFCDVVQFPNTKIGRIVAQVRQSALGMVLVQTPEHILAFRRQCPKAGPITFVPIDNPNWPEFELPWIESKGFLGYAFDHVQVLDAYKSLHHTVIKSILKELVLFDTADNAMAHGNSVGAQPYAAIMDNDHHINYQLTFLNPLREELRHLPVKKRIQELLKRIEAIDQSITRVTYRY